MFRSSPTRCTGIHVAANGIYAVELSRRKQSVSLSRCAAVPVAASLSLPDALADHDGRASLVQALRLLHGDGFDVERPYFALSGAGVFIKRRFVLARDKGMTREQLLWEAEQLLAEDIDDYVVDTLATRHHGFFIAARRQILDLYGVLCREAGMGRPGFDMSSFALCNALESCGVGGEGIEIVLQEDGEIMRAVLLRDGEYEGESVWSQQEKGPATGLGLLCNAELDQGEVAHRLWVVGSGDAGGAVDLGEFADEVGDLNPFVGLTVSEMAKETLASNDVPARAYVVAAGLAFRGLADA